MARVKGAKHALKHRKTILKQTKGFRFGQSTKERQARQALFHAGRSAFQDRRKKKGQFRRLWNIKINAALDQIESSLSYSKFIKALKDAEIGLDRKSLAHIAEHKPESFKRIVEKVS
ncbi:MAG: 50S ribosomal protein L20 [Candidatus Paceibacterota bacterium]